MVSFIVVLEGTNGVFLHVIFSTQDIVKALEMFNNQNSNFTDGWIDSEFNSSPSAHMGEKMKISDLNILIFFHKLLALFLMNWFEIRYFYGS